IAKNEEKFISFSKRLNSYNPEAKEKAESKIPKERSSAFYLKFIDSHNFLNESLSNLAKNLKDNKPILRHFFPDDDKFKLLSRKLPFPYDYFDCVERLMETKLASRGAFFNRLTGEKCSKLEYRYAQEVWDTFQCKTMKNFMHIYLTVDVLIF